MHGKELSEISVTDDKGCMIPPSLKFSASADYDDNCNKNSESSENTYNGGERGNEQDHRSEARESGDDLF